MLNLGIYEQSSNWLGKPKGMFDIINHGFTDYTLKLITGVYPKQIDLEIGQLQEIESLFNEI